MATTKIIRYKQPTPEDIAKAFEQLLIVCLDARKKQKHFEEHYGADNRKAKKRKEIVLDNLINSYLVEDTDKLLVEELPSYS